MAGQAFRPQAVLAAAKASTRSHRFFSTKYCSVVAVPAFTSCVHCSSGNLIPNALSMANAISRKSRLSMPRSLIAWLSGLMVSRGISQVSEIIPAIVSNVEVIGNPLIDQVFWKLCRPGALTRAEERKGSQTLRPCRVLLIAKQANDFNVRSRIGQARER